MAHEELWRLKPSTGSVSMDGRIHSTNGHLRDKGRCISQYVSLSGGHLSVAREAYPRLHPRPPVSRRLRQAETRCAGTVRDGRGQYMLWFEGCKGSTRAW